MTRYNSSAQRHRTKLEARPPDFSTNANPLIMKLHAIDHTTKLFLTLEFVLGMKGIHIPLPLMAPGPETPPLILPLRCTSTLPLRELSKLFRTLLLELRLRALRVSSGSCGLSPLAFANRFRTSVKLTTPQRRPDMLAPVMAEAEIAGAG